MPRAHRRNWIAVTVFVLALAAGDAHASVSMAIDPEFTVVEPGGEFTVDIVLAEAGDPINGYDAIVGYDPSRLELVSPARRSDAEGPLFVDACPQRFLNIAVSEDSTAVTVSHVLLCAGANVVGPGSIFTLRFRARATIGQTQLTLFDGTAAYDAGEFVEPLVMRDARVWIGDATGAPARPAWVQLRAVPNPFNPRTELRYELSEPQRVCLEVYDAAGRRVDTIYEGWAAPGPFRHSWDGRDGSGRPVASGVYFARLTTPAGIHEVTSMVLVR
jgi:hypothetical protein